MCDVTYEHETFDIDVRLAKKEKTHYMESQV
jgi:hypothetical protein